MKYVLIFLLVFCIVRLNKCSPLNSSVLISKYAKVAVWGRNKTNTPDIGDGRHSKNVKMWNHRLDPKSISSNTKMKNPAIAYQYPVYQGPDPKLNQKMEHVPGIGEVIVAQAQDRFEARPLFAYKNKLAAAYGPPPAPKPSSPMSSSPPRPSAAPPPVAPPPILAPPSAPPISDLPGNSFLPFSNPPVPPISAANPNEDLYNSPYSSYNPPDFKPDDSGSDFYPPNGPPDGDSDDNKPVAPPMEAQNDSTEAPKASIPDSYASLGPPLAYGDTDHHHGHGPMNYGNPDQSHDPMAIYKNHDGPPDYPPKNEHDIYYSPDFPKDQIPYHNIQGHGDDMMKQPQDSMMAPPQDSMMAPPQASMMAPPQDLMMMQQGMMDSGQANGEADLAPPPEHDYGHSFPKYLYDSHHYDHHVYEEIPHTTMAPVKEDKRVSSTNYSYYYLGRKLWYIPLYFSVYFIIYVTVLILKSIARHKVRLKYKWYEHDTSAKQARSMDLNSVQSEKLMDLHQNVYEALRNTTEKYDSILAM